MADTLPSGDTNPGKLIPVNDNDFDFDNIADYYDGYDGKSLAGVSFVQLAVDVPSVDLTKLKIRFEYNASNPASVTTDTQSQGSGDGGGSLWTTRDGKIYKLPSGSKGTRGQMRLWTKDGGEARSSGSVLNDGDFIPDDTWIEFSKLNGGSEETSITLFIEGITYSSFPGDDEIKFDLDINGDGTMDVDDADTVKVTAIDVYLKNGSGGGFLERDDYTFASTDFSNSSTYQPSPPSALSATSNNPAALPIYSLMDGGSMDIATQMLPPSPQSLEEYSSHYIGERGQGGAPIAPTSVTPEYSGSINQTVTVTSDGGKGFTFLDIMPTFCAASNGMSGLAGVVVFEQRNVELGVRRVHQRSADLNYDAPAFSPSDAQALETYLNDQVYKPANINWTVTLLDDLEMDFDTDNVHTLMLLGRMIC